MVDKCCVACVAGTTAPDITPTTTTNTCPTTTVSLAGLANTGTKPVGTTLVWSTHKVPTSVGDTLTNLTTVSTAGKYYALYFDKVSSCYSPADSVEVSFIVCNLSPDITSATTATTPENVGTTTPVYTATATDPNSGQTKTFSLETGGIDNGLFSIDPLTGVVTFIASPNFEIPTDAGGNNVYDIKVKVCDNGSPVLCDIQDVAITVTDVIECIAGTNAPIIPSTLSNICPATTADFTGLNTGTKPVGTTLIWSTNKVPTSVGDTLTNLTTVSTAGKYYALYYDKVGNCYSPADSVEVSFIVCPCPNPLVALASTSPTTCGGSDGQINLSGLTASTSFTINYQKDGGAVQSVVVLSDASGKAIITGLTIGSYTNIQALLPCVSNKVATTVFAPASCISPIITPQDSTITACTPLTTLGGGPNATATTCPGYPKVLGATATVAIVNGEVCITYKPKPGYVGTDSVCVTLCDPITLACTTLKIPVTVEPVPLAINDINLTMVNIPTSGSVATNDTKTATTDTFTEIVSPVNATSFVFNPDGTYTYTPKPDFVGKDSVQYQICSVAGNCSTAWLYLTVYGPTIGKNLPPIAQNDVAQTNVNMPVSGNLGSNDFDPEKGPLLFNNIPVTNPTNGTVTINPNGTFTYTPTTGFIGTDTFKYEVCDELNQCITATATVYVRPDPNGITNDKPNAQDDSYKTVMDVAVTANVRLNDSDPNGNILTTSVVSTVSNGTLVLTSTGGMTYTPAAGYYGTDKFTYKACDAAGLCDTATVYLVVEPPLPNAQNDINVTLKNTPVSGNILTNDSAGGLAIMLNTTPVVAPSNGTIIINANGTYTYIPNAGFVGKDSVRYAMCSASMVCDTAWLSINVIDPKIGTNNPPVANDDVAQTLKNIPVIGKVTNNDLDPDGDPLSVSVLNQPSNGTLVMNPDGTFTYTPDPGFTGRDTFNYVVCDNNGACDTASVVITVTPDFNGTANDKPNAQDDAALTNINTKVTGSLKINDTDPNGNTLTYTTTPILAASNGTVTITSTGTYTYTPATGYFGTDQFTYKVCDNGSPSLCDTATVYLTILPPTPDAQNDINVTFKNKAVTGNTATNDNGNGIPFTTNVALTVQPLHGTLTIGGNGAYTYTPALNYVGKDSAQYVICNASDKCDTAWIFVSILPDPLINGNNKPVAQNDVAQTLVDKPVSGKVTNNDIDLDGTPSDGEPLTVSLTTSPTNGTLILNPDGTFTYTPDAGFVGVDKFCYKACDLGGLCDTACVMITISPDLNGTANDKPNAQDDAALTTMNTAVTGQLKPNDTDPNGNALTYTATPILAPLHGTVTISPTTGQFVFTPTTGYVGTDAFTYKVCDNGTPSLCDTATVYLTIVPPNKKPDAINDINVTFKNTPTTGNVVTNDNLNGLVATTTLITPAKNGTLTLLPNGTYTYVPNANYVGKDSARYVLCDAINVCDTAWISLNVMPYPPSSVDNNKPVASNDVAVTNMNVPVSGSVGNNDIDPDLTQTLTFTKLTDPTPAQGTVVFNNNGTFTFTPTTGFVGNVTFQYKVCDSGTPVKCDTASVTIEVKPQSTQPNDKPVANDDAFVTYQGVGINGNAAPNDNDPNGNTLIFSKVSNPANGTVIMNANGTFSYAPNATFIGTDSFTYKICDNGTPSLCDTATVYLTVEPPKQPTANKPDAVNDIAMTVKDTPVTGNVLTNDDSKGNPVVAGLVSGNPPQHGVVTLNPNGTYTYTPTAGYVGKDSVKYVLCVDEIPLAKCDTAYIYFNVMDVPTAQNDKPIANNDVATTETGTPVKGNVLANDVDPDLTDVLTASKLTDPAHGTVTVNPDGTYTYTPTAGYVGKDYFTYKVCDNGTPVKCDSAKVEIDVTPVITPLNANVKPAAQDDALLTKINTPKSGTVAPNDTDPNIGQTLVFSQLSNTTNGTITGFNPTTGAYTYTPTAGFVGNDSFKYKVCDNGTPVLCDSATVIITVEPNNRITAPVAQNDIAITSPNTPVKGNVLTNDDGKGNPLTSSLVTPPTNGTIVFNPDGSYTYTPTLNYIGRDSVKYKVCNLLIPAECDSAWLFINVIPYPTVGNDKPVAMPDNAVTQSGSPVTSSVLGNDYDPDLGQTLTASKVSDPTNGTVTVNPNGTYTYTPTTGFVGTDVFKYKVCDNGTPQLCDTTSVTIKVTPIDPTVPVNANLKPDAGDDVVVSTGGQPVTTTVIGNDRDPNAGQTLTYTLLNQPAKGTVTLSSTGTLVWTPVIDPALPGATYTVKYKVCDNGSPVLCDTATVELRNQPSVTQPDAQDDIAVAKINSPITGNVLTNDDKKGLPVTVAVLTPPANGTFVVNPDGTYTYTPTAGTPAAGFVGTDSVQYKICNNQVPVECDSAWVTISVIPEPAVGVNDKPVASNDVTQTNAGVPVNGNASTNDFDPDLGQTLAFTKLTNPTNGTATMNPDGTFTYTPNPGFVGTDVFTYKVCDNGTPVLCDTAKVVITVEPVTTNPAVNEPPVAVDDVIAGIVGKPVTYNVGSNDKDPEGTPLAFTKLGGNPNVTIDALGNVTYTPQLDPITGLIVGGNTVTYKVCDNGSPVKCDTATINLTVTVSPTQPLAVNDINNTLINTTVTGTVLTNDDTKDLPVLVTQLTTANHGVVTINPDGTYTFIPTTNFVGKDSVQYQICNNQTPAECSKAWLYLNVAPAPTTANDKPIANPDVAQTLVNTPVSGKVTNNDTDPENGILTATKLTNPTNGTLVFNPDGTFTYTPNTGFTGKDKFTYKICDTGTPVLCDTASVTIDVQPKLTPNGANDKPTAQDDAISTTLNTPKTATVAPNDTDPNIGQTLAFAKVTDPAHGAVVVNPDGSYTYTPISGYAGPDKFTYKVCDNGTPSLCDTATVYVDVLPIPVPTPTQPEAENDIAVAKVNTPITGNVLTNDDKKGLPVTVAVVTPPANGTFVLNPDGTYTYTPTTGTPAAGFVGTDSVQYKICNNQVPVECDSAWVTISVIPEPAVGVNDKPVASNDVLQTTAGAPVSGNASTNDFDPDKGQTLAFTKLTNPANGTTTMNPDGTFTYTPNTGFTGEDSFKYKVCDNGTPVLCDTATVTITVKSAVTPGVNQAPVAVDDVVAGIVGKTLTYNVGGNDKDPEGTPLAFSKLGGNPNVTIDALGNVTYTPQLDPITGLIVGGNTVTYKVCDNGSPVKCDTATINLTVTVSPTQPLAVNDMNNTLINTTVTGTVLTNDDTKGLPVLVSQLTSALNGTLIINPNGTYGYLPASNFVGKDSVQYQICNNETPAECSKAWLFINVAPAPLTANDKPVANPDAAQTLVNTPVTGKVTNNDTDPEGGVLTATKLTNPTNGTVVFNPDGTFTYTPTTGFIGKDKFTYKVCDTGTSVLCDTASVTIDVQPKLTAATENDKPTAQDDAISTNINTPKTATVAPNDTDPNAGQTLAFAKVTNPAHGTVTMTSDGDYTYTPTTGYTGPDRFTYKVCDNGIPSLCDTATVYVDILPLPVPSATTPLAINDINITPKDVPATGNVLTNDDKKGLPVTASVLTPPTNGTIVLNPNGTYTYTPTTGFVGKDSVQYQICNNKVPVECDVAWLFVNVQNPPAVSPTNNKPTAINDVNQTPMNLPVSGTVAANDFDSDLGQTLAFTKLTNPTSGTVVFNANGTYTYTPAVGFVGTDVFTYQVCDNQSPALCDQTSVTIKVTPDNSGGGNIKPVANDDAYTTNKGVGITKNASLNDNDPNAGQTLAYTLLSIPANGTVTFNSNGTFNYAPSATFVGTDKFMYKICDNGTPSLCDTATVYVSVTEPVVNVCVNFNLKVLLEGPLNTTTGLMSNLLNTRGLLPGQTPIGATATPTPNGQPYSGAPWNYAGTEVMPIGGYAADIVDWVLVSLRTDSLTTSPVFRAAGLLHQDGSITFASPCFTIANGSYYVLIEHRNHMGVMSDKKVLVTSGTLTYDFTTKDSYALTNPPSYGQKLKGTKYVMYAADHKKTLTNDNYDINAADSNLWKVQSGIFDRYMSGDYNFDADVNSADNTLWKFNSGRFSGVAH
ncbi:MAG: Ig-like domain-containing protein [Arcicella sp.]|nr:Ig-like domain-containing protein [Arcicella sp.]